MRTANLDMLIASHSEGQLSGYWRNAIRAAVSEDILAAQSEAWLAGVAWANKAIVQTAKAIERANPYARKERT